MKRRAKNLLKQVKIIQNYFRKIIMLRKDRYHLIELSVRYYDNINKSKIISKLTPQSPSPPPIDKKEKKDKNKIKKSNENQINIQLTEEEYDKISKTLFDQTNEEKKRIKILSIKTNVPVYFLYIQFPYMKKMPNYQRIEEELIKKYEEKIKE